MREGKIAESILKRSVLSKIKLHKGEVLKGAGVGEDCAFFSLAGSCITTQTVALPVKQAAYLAFYAAANNLTAAGSEPVFAEAAITLPKDAEEVLLQEIMDQLISACNEWKMELAGGHTEVSPFVSAPVISVTAVGRQTEASIICAENDDKGMEALGTANRKQTENKKQTENEFALVVSKWVGLEGSYILATEKERKLLGRYPAGLVRDAQKFSKLLSTAPEAEIALKNKVIKMHDIRNGGIFGALWDISKLLHTGLTVDLKKIPIKQETIEICELFNMNPYMLLSGGSLLMVARDGDALAEALEAEGISAAVVGHTTENNDKLILNRDETCYITPARQDEIYKIF